MEKTKYFRTYHFPFSKSVTSDDRISKDYSFLENREVIISEKLDGENCLDKNTMLITEDGPKTIQDVCESKYSGKVLSYDIETGEEEWDEIVNWSMLENKNSQWYEITLEDDSIILITGNHRVWLPELGCYRKVDDLSEEDEFLLKS